MVSGQMKALLGVLAVAGYQNREKIGELLRGLQQPGKPGNDERQQGGLGGVFGNSGGGAAGSGGLGGLGGLGSILGGLASGNVLGGGLGDLLKTFQQNGQGEKAESWVRKGENASIDETQLSQAIGPDVLKELSERTGLSSQEILSRLSRDLPGAVDDLTPEGKLPEDDTAQRPGSGFGI
jgi:uncharacterized protein YidB (DUF937 family)